MKPQVSATFEAPESKSLIHEGSTPPLTCGYALDSLTPPYGGVLSESPAPAPPLGAATNECPHGIENGNHPDPYVRGRLACPLCRRGTKIPCPVLRHSPRLSAGAWSCPDCDTEIRT